MKDKECNSNHNSPAEKSKKKLVIVAVFALISMTQLCSLNVYSGTGNESLTYQQAIYAYRVLDSIYPAARLFNYGKTDCGESLNLFVISGSENFDPSALQTQNKCILFINNGIHPGEPDGIDASVQLATELLSKPLYRRMLENVVVCIVPVFNIDGALERGCCSRANQNGPEAYGFRANAKNLDLNRDFVKTDSRNAKSIISILRKWNPDVFIDTHVSDGADYQYTMTLITAQHDKLRPAIGKFLHDELNPAIYSLMKEKNDEIIPYVDTYKGNQVPDSGIIAFMESPRYLGGYQSLYNCITFIAESHMLKPFPQRVKSTVNLLHSFVEVCNEKCADIISARKRAAGEIESVFKYNWTLDTTRCDTIPFKGYKAELKKSKVTTGKRLFYDRSKPYSKMIRFFNRYVPSDSMTVPKYFILPQAWEELASKLELNGVQLTRVREESQANGTVFYIDDYQTAKRPYEGHYLHYDVTLRKKEEKINIRKGDYLVPMPQENMRFALEALIPDATDSYFCWGFFDSMLQQKEWFSDYVFEDIADSLLEKDPQLKKDFREWQSNNKNAGEYEQLLFIYKRSQFFEKNYMRYPVIFVY